VANIGETEAEVRPTAIIPILEIGLQRSEKETNISVDAAKVNPRSKAAMMVERHQ